MAREKEIKIRLTSLNTNEFVVRIKALGFKLIDIEQQEDVYFDTTDWHLYEHLAALRIRKVAGKDKSFSFKKMFYIPGRLDPYHIEEIEVKLPLTADAEFKTILAKLQIRHRGELPTNSSELTAFLATHGYLDEQHMPKTRSIYKKGDNEVVIDKLEQIGTVIELECAKDEPMVLVNTLLKQHEWERSTEGTSYMWLAKVKGLSSHSANVERFKTEPSWNVWRHENSLYQGLAEASN